MDIVSHKIETAINGIKAFASYGVGANLNSSGMVDNIHLQRALTALDELKQSVSNAGMLKALDEVDLKMVIADELTTDCMSTYLTVFKDCDLAAADLIVKRIRSIVGYPSSVSEEEINNLFWDKAVLHQDMEDKDYWSISKKDWKIVCTAIKAMLEERNT